MMSSELQRPFFSIVIPMYNREGFICRAVDSCLRQSYRDFELIIVDDGSVDSSVAVAKRIEDPRITVVEHRDNKGVCAARNSGIRTARGLWVVCLDSDDELADEALALIAMRAKSLNDDIKAMRFCSLRDDGLVAPQILPSENIVDYHNHLRWIEAVDSMPSDCPIVTRLETFQSVPYPNDRSYETTYHLNLAMTFRVRWFRDVVLLNHLDADNSISRGMALNIRENNILRDNARSNSDILKRHGQAMRRWAPTAYCRILRNTSYRSFVVGDQRAGIQYALRLLAFRPTWVSAIGILVVGIGAPKRLSNLRSTVTRFRRLGFFRRSIKAKFDWKNGGVEIERKA